MRFCKSLILLRGNQAIKAAYDRFIADIEDESGGGGPSAPLRIRDLQFSQFPEMTKWKFSVGCGHYP
jgi:hypothetical protein